jgi:hypothetical protein
VPVQNQESEWSCSFGVSMFPFSTMCSLHHNVSLLLFVYEIHKINRYLIICFSYFFIFPFLPSFHSLPFVLFLLFYTLLCFLPVRMLSPYPYHFILSLLPVLHPLFLSSSLLPLCPPLICIIFIRLFYLTECKTGEKGQKGDCEKRAKKEK